MSDCATSGMRFETQTALALQAAFDGGRITSDGGLVWLSQTDSEMGLFAKPSRNRCRRGERGRGATLWPRSLGSASFR